MPPTNTHSGPGKPILDDRDGVQSYIVASAAIGLWALSSPLFFPGPVTESLGDVVAGLILLGLAGYNYYLYRHHRCSVESPRVATLVGLLLVPFSIHAGSGGILASDGVMLGVAIAVVNGYYYRRIRHRRFK